MKATSSLPPGPTLSSASDRGYHDVSVTDHECVWDSSTRPSRSPKSAFNVPRAHWGTRRCLAPSPETCRPGQGTSGVDSDDKHRDECDRWRDGNHRTRLRCRTWSVRTRRARLFNRTSAIYQLTTTVNVNGLNIGDAVVLTTDSAVTGGTIPAPAPTGAVMLLSALPVAWLWRRRQVRAA